MKTEVKKLTVKYQAGVDSWTTNYRDIFEFGSKLDLSGNSSSANLYGTTNDVINSLFTLNYNLNITDDFNMNVLVGNEYNHQNTKDMMIQEQLSTLVVSLQLPMQE